MDETERYVKNVRAAWEKLRIVYNLVLLLEGLTCLWLLWLLAEFAGQPFGFDFWFFPVILFGAVANALYCLGPVADACAYRFLGWRMGRARCFLFGTGLLFSMGVLLLPARRLFFHLAGYLV